MPRGCGDSKPDEIALVFAKFLVTCPDIKPETREGTLPNVSMVKLAESV